MSAARRPSVSLAGIIHLICIAILIKIWGVPAVGALMNQYEVAKRTGAISQQSILAAQEDTYMNVCSHYAAASTWDRWTTKYYWKISWCEDYLHRLPPTKDDVQFSPIKFIAD